ncbi:MAG: ATP-dependent helicase, partial [Anaerolineales bacterium]|nr:ATP-dependent helicase [Anaerolineales bacterium]
MDYTDSQTRAIHTVEQNLQIIACAGSGKTQVISRRIVEILSRGARPSEIVAFTFTEKAAGELKDRIDRLCLDILGSNQGLGDMFVGTIHGYCLSLLQSPPLYKYLKYSILDDIQQRLLIDRHSTRSGLTSVPLLSGGHLKRWLDSALYQQLIAILNEGAVNLSLVPVPVQAAVAQYHALMHEQRYLDYSMIIGEAVKALTENDGLRARVAEQLRYLVVDEYQDVNPLQERLIRILHDLGANLCVVGDDDQTIYQWRGSDVANIISFAQRYPGVSQIRLNENFRSSQAVIESARVVIEENPERLPKRMESTEMQPTQIGDVLALQFPDPEAEAAWIVSRIQALYGTAYQDRPERPARGLSYGDFAILLRSVRNDAGPITAALDEAGIPFVVSGMNELFGQPEIQLARAIFYFMADHDDGQNGPVTEQQLAHYLHESGLGLTPARAKQGIELLRDRKLLLAQNRTDANLFLQRVFLDFLEALTLREEEISTRHGRTGELIFYNLGKFSQVITDYEQINFKSSPQSLYQGFAGFLQHQAPNYYPEGWEDAGYAQPDAVQIMTVHKAKGMQWPAVFVPCLRNNRFPSKRQGGRQVWHVIPEAAVPNVERYKGTLEDERRLYYVAVTRAERYLYCSYSGVPDKRLYKKVSPFQLEMTNIYHVYTEPLPPPDLPKLKPQPRREEVTLTLTFSELKYFFDCPYSFKLRFLYGFDEPINQAIGYGKSLHDALAEVHAESLNGQIPRITDVPDIIDRHLHLPFARDEVVENTRRVAERTLRTYLARNQMMLDKLEHVEKTVELKLGDGIVVNGRIDLIRRLDTGETAVVDFKSTERAQAEDITRQQLQVYALGYEQLTGSSPDLIEIRNLDNGGVNRERINRGLIQETIIRV